MSAPKYPITPAVRVLREAGVSFTPHLYDYVERGGTAHSASVLNVPEHTVIKTLVLQTEVKIPLLVLMHGDRELSLGVLAHQLNVKNVTLCDAKSAHKITGYELGGTSPFGVRTASVPVYAERTIFDLPEVLVNGGKRGFLVSLAPSAFLEVCGAKAVDAAAPPAVTKTAWS